ncbi:MAG: PTS sugar transporter subunit IIA [Planctomycetota bacterium]|nr:MAG: PTS sugar transporter subunit IIA [Planctomycetota bacterium]
MLTSIFKEMVEEKRIIFLESLSKKEVLKEMVGLVSPSDAAPNAEELLQALLEREEIMSTGIGYGIAVPHVKIPSVKKIIMALGIHKKGIDWGTLLDNDAVKIVVLIAAPDYKTKEYLKLLAKVVKLLKNKETRDEILQAQTVEEVGPFFLQCHE